MIVAFKAKEVAGSTLEELIAVKGLARCLHQWYEGEWVEENNRRWDFWSIVRPNSRTSWEPFNLVTRPRPSDQSR